MTTRSAALRCLDYAREALADRLYLSPAARVDMARMWIDDAYQAAKRHAVYQHPIWTDEEIERQVEAAHAIQHLDPWCLPNEVDGLL